MIRFLVFLVGCGSAATPDLGGMLHQRVLFVGNSFTYVNDVPGHYHAMLQDVEVEQVTPGGYTLAQHAADARTDGTDLARWLRTGTAEETAFDAVVLQEQSQIGGFVSWEAARIASIAGAADLSGLARDHGDKVVLYETWGYRNGDSSNVLLGYGSYLGMQDHLDEGYLGLTSLLREDVQNEACLQNLFLHPCT